jgi:imidazolonepropionase-like amidohydrolase
MMMEVRARWPRAGLAFVLAAFVLTPSLLAQFGRGPRPAVVLRGGTVHVGNGDVIEGGVVILRGSRIEAVGAGLPSPEGAREIDVTGLQVYPGLIDAESSLGIDPDMGRNGGGNLAGEVADAIDPFDRDAIGLAWKGGVTAVGATSRRALFDGRAAVLKLRGRDPDGLLLERAGPVCVTFARQSERPSAMLREWKTFADELAATRKYIEAWDEYSEKLEEYSKALGKLRESGDTKLDPDAKKAEAPAGGPPPERPSFPQGGARRGFPRRRPDGGAPQSAADAAFLDWLAAVTGRTDLGHVDPPETDGDGDGHDESGQRAGFSDGVSFAEEPAEPAKTPEGEKKDDEPKKPEKPGRDPGKEILRLVLEGKAALSVRIDGAADLENLLALAREHRFRFSIAGGGEAVHVAEDLAAAKVPVVLVQPHDLGSDRLSDAAELDRAGVVVALTTAGTSGEASRHLSLAAAAAVAGGMDRERALMAITSRAAEALGVGHRIGTLEAGKDADVVVVRGELFSTTAVVEHVFVEGAQVVTGAEVTGR